MSNIPLWIRRPNSKNWVWIKNDVLEVTILVNQEDYKNEIIHSMKKYSLSFSITTNKNYEVLFFNLKTEKNNFLNAVKDCPRSICFKKLLKFLLIK